MSQPPIHCARCGQRTVPRMVDHRVRPACPHCGAVVFKDPKLAVAVVILRAGESGTEVLLGHRAAHTRNPGTWSFPAGFVERGERPEDAAAREVHEETGLTVTLGPLLGVWSTTGDSTVLLAWRADTVSGDVIAQDDLTRLGWFPASDPPPLGFGHDAAILRLALAGTAAGPR